MPETLVEVGPKTTIKRFNRLEDWQTELRAYQSVPWACPKLIRYGQNWLELETLPHADKTCLEALRTLLERLSDEGWHHRDVTVRNVLWRDAGAWKGPVLIDWECAIYMPGHRSYDLHGPDSGVPVVSPSKYRWTKPQWWGANLGTSIGKIWGYI